MREHCDDKPKRQVVTKPADGSAPRQKQVDPEDVPPPRDIVDEASNDSFPCSDPPGFNAGQS